VQRDAGHLRIALISFSLLASSSLRKSLVFWARSLRWVRVSLWCATRSEATVSSCGTRLVRSMSASAVSATKCFCWLYNVLRHAPIAFWNLFSSALSPSFLVASWEVLLSLSERPSMPGWASVDLISSGGYQGNQRCHGLCIWALRRRMGGFVLTRRLQTAFSMHT